MRSSKFTFAFADICFDVPKDKFILKKSIL